MAVAYPTQEPLILPAPGYQGQNELVQNTADKKEIDRLRSTCDLWKVYAPQWDLYLSAYEGGPDMVDDRHIFKHQRENDDDWKDRIKRADYINYCEVLVDFFSNFIFQETIQREWDDNRAWYDEFKKNVDRKENTIDDFMKTGSDNQQIYGMEYTLVDSPTFPPGTVALTVQQVKEMGVGPYFIHIATDEITDWVSDDFDNFFYVKRCQHKVEITDNVKRVLEIYTEWYQNKVETSKIDVTDPKNPRLLAKDPPTINSLGYIPIVVTRYKRSKRNPEMGNSFLRDFAGNNQKILNISSLIDEFLYRQCFNILAKETEQSIPTRSQEDGEISSANVLEYPRGAKPPAYISPPSDPAKFLQEERERIKQEMFRRAAQDTLNELFNGEKSSGFSQAQSFSKTVPFISSRADALERTETKLMAIVGDFLGKKWTGKIKYKDRYEITNLTDAITQLSMLAKDLQIMSPTFFGEEMKRIVQEYDGKMTAETKNAVLLEIDETDWPAWQETQKFALIGMPKPEGSSPAAQQKPKSTGTMAEASKESKKTKVGATKKVQS